jgi:putative transposase
LDKKLTLKYLDESGFSLMLPLCYTWFKKGSGKQFAIPTRWGSQGRINLIGTYSLHGDETILEYRELAKTCKQESVIAYLETLFTEKKPEELLVIVLDNATFHKSSGIKGRRSKWEKGEMFLRYLPAYAPELNPIEGIWRVVKGFLMPRRCYNSLDELRKALLVALQAVGGIKI